MADKKDEKTHVSALMPQGSTMQNPYFDTTHIGGTHHHTHLTDTQHTPEAIARRRQLQENPAAFTAAPWHLPDIPPAFQPTANVLTKTLPGILKKHRACLVGPGGSGKTAHAIAYAHGATYPFIVFLRGDAEGLEADLRALSRHIAESIPQGSSIEEISKNLYTRLQSVPMLFIIDDINADPTAKYLGWLPPYKIDGEPTAYHCLLTSRRKSPWQKRHGVYPATLLPLKGLEKEKSVALVQKLLQEIELPSGVQYDVTWQKALCDTLEHIPLALSTIMVFLIVHHRLQPNTPLSITDLLETHFPTSINTRANHIYLHTPLTTWLRHLGAIHRANAATLPLLFAIAYLAPRRPIPLSLLELYHVNDAPNTTTNVAAYLQIMEDYALVTFQGSSLTMLSFTRRAQGSSVTMLSIMQRVFVWWLSEGVERNRIASLVAEGELHQQLGDIQQTLQRTKLTSAGIIENLTHALSNFIAKTYRETQHSLIWSDSGMLEHSTALLHTAHHTGESLPRFLLPIFYASLMAAYTLRGRAGMLAEYAELISKTLGMTAPNERNKHAAEVTRTLFVLLLRKANGSRRIPLSAQALGQIKSLINVVNTVSGHEGKVVLRFLPTELTQWDNVSKAILQLPKPFSYAPPNETAFPLLGNSELAKETRQLLYPGNGPDNNSSLLASILGFSSKSMAIKSTTARTVETLAEAGASSSHVPPPVRDALLIKCLAEQGLRPATVASTLREMQSSARALLSKDKSKTLPLLIGEQAKELDTLATTILNQTFEYFARAELTGRHHDKEEVANHCFELGFYDLSSHYYKMAENAAERSRNEISKDIYARWSFCHLMLNQPLEAESIFHRRKIACLNRATPNRQTTQVCLAAYYISKQQFSEAIKCLAFIDPRSHAAEAYFGFNLWSPIQNIPWVQSLLTDTSPYFSLATHQLAALLTLHCSHELGQNRLHSFEVPPLVIGGRQFSMRPTSHPSRENHSPQRTPLGCYRALSVALMQTEGYVEIDAPLPHVSLENRHVLCGRLLNTIMQSTLSPSEQHEATSSPLAALTPSGLNDYQPGIFAHFISGSSSANKGGGDDLEAHISDPDNDYQPGIFAYFIPASSSANKGSNRQLEALDEALDPDEETEGFVHIQDTPPNISDYQPGIIARHLLENSARSHTTSGDETQEGEVAQYQYQ